MFKEESNISTRDFSQLEQYIGQVMKEHSCPGLSIAIAAGDEIVYAKGYGRRNENNDKVTPDTIFGIASITKSFTAVAISQLCEAGKMSLEDPVKKHLPDFNPPEYADEIKIIHLLNHTSGLPLLPTMLYSMRTNSKRNADEPLPADLVQIKTSDDLLNYIAQGNHKMLGEPGRYINYSNDGYALLGAVIESVSGMSFGQFLKQHILMPLGMTRTTVDLSEMLEHQDVTELYYHNDANEIKHTANWQEAPSHVACGWLRSCATDLIRYWQMLANQGTYQGRQIIAPHTWEQILSRRAEFTLQRFYGLGVRIQPNYQGETIVDHTGGLRGISANAGFVKDKGIAVAVLSNLSGFSVSLVFSAAINYMLGLPLDKPRYVYPKVQWTQEEMARRTGSFSASEGFTEPMTIEHKDGQLLLHKGEETHVLAPANAHTAVLDVVGQDMSKEIRFHEDAEGRVWSIGSNNRIFPRTES